MRKVQVHEKGGIVDLIVEDYRKRAIRLAPESEEEHAKRKKKMDEDPRLIAATGSARRFFESEAMAHPRHDEDFVASISMSKSGILDLIDEDFA